MKVYKYNLKQCKKCGNEFRPLKEVQQYCSIGCRQVETICKQCNSVFTYNANKSVEFCSRKCVEDYKNKEKRVTVICKNCNTSFVVAKCNSNGNKYCSRKCKDVYQKIMFVGKDNPNYGNRKPGMFTHSDITKQIIKEKVLASWKTENRLIKYNEGIQKFVEKYGTHPLHTITSKLKAIKTLRDGYSSGKYKIYTHGKCGEYTSIKTNITEWYQSSYELSRMLELDVDDNVSYWTKKHKISIPLNNKNYYIPDFLIEYTNGRKTIEEVKGYVRDIELHKLKIKKSIEYIKNNDIDDYIVNFMLHLRNKKVIK